MTPQTLSTHRLAPQVFYPHATVVLAKSGPIMKKSSNFYWNAKPKTKNVRMITNSKGN